MTETPTVGYSQEYKYKQKSNHSSDRGGHWRNQNSQYKEGISNTRHENNPRANFKGHKAQYYNSNGSRFPKVPERGAVRCPSCNKLGHLKKDCNFTSHHCFVCGKVGHISPACRFRKGPNKQQERTNEHRDVKEKLNTEAL